MAVVGLDLTVGRGEVVSILGPNGAGKTTSVRMLTGLLVPTSGEASVGGYDVARHRRRAALACGVSLGGDSGLYPRLSAAQNLTFFGLMYGLRGRSLDRRVRELLSLVDLGDRAGDLVGTYSRGMKQRVHLARALLHDPPVLILDEPSAGLDPQSARSMRALVRKLATDGRSVLLTTHDMREAEDLSNLVVLMKGGAVHAEATPAQLRVRAAERLGHTVEIVWNDDVPAPDCRSCPGLLDVAHDNGVTRLRVRSGAEAVRWAFDRFGAQAANVSVSSPSLEEVFLERAVRESSS
ncbi:ABC transporter ATP-binding protein [Micromonospora sp. NBC_01655]|uniref:ABC transporter ATP-binding protein n=1 Tax=Micromonospora sp. NBC_01655 TaxID=2975983 RepID=UPI00224ED300|nr:ABC transporter ATP-binding protein [Micromonospora sp. NBC_01655]MCX4474618.1 ABC transporter ATP-binding protein [Micromonospora sp. NBC_01655]